MEISIANMQIKRDVFFPGCPDVIRQAAAYSIFQEGIGAAKEHIRSYISEKFNYDLSRSVDDIRPTYSFDISCQGTVPEAIISFLDSDSYEDAIRNAVSLGGDSDTLACITGGIAEAFYGEIPVDIREEAIDLLPPDLLRVVDTFREVYR